MAAVRVINGSTAMAAGVCLHGRLMGFMGEGVVVVEGLGVTA